MDNSEPGARFLPEVRVYRRSSSQGSTFVIGLAALSGAERVTHLARRHGTTRKFVRAQRERAGHALELAFAEPSAPLRVELFPQVSDAWVWRCRMDQDS